MEKIKGFDNFVDEAYSFRDSISKVSDWLKGFFGKIKEGIIRKIPSGPKAGLPMVYYFKYEGPGSIVSKLQEFYSQRAEQDVAIGEAKKTPDNLNPFSSEEELKKRLGAEEYGVADIGPIELEEEIVEKFEFNAEGTYSGNIFIFGAPGIGKTEIVGQAAERVECDLMVVDLQFMQPADFIGLPSKVDIEMPNDTHPFGRGVTRQNPPTWLPVNNGESGNGGILFFDEMNRANAKVLESLLTLCGSGRNIGSFYKMPAKWIIVGAGNRKKDEKPGKSTIKEIDPALAGRFTFWNYVPTIEGLIKHVRKSESPIFKIKRKDPKLANPIVPIRKELPRDVVIPELLQFLCVERGWLHTLDPLSKAIKSATPRSWIDSCKRLYSTLQLKKKRGEISDLNKMTVEESNGIILKTFEQSVGKLAAKQFADFYESLRDVPDNKIRAIYDNGLKSAPPPKNSNQEDQDELELVVSSLAFRVEKLYGPSLEPAKFKNALDWVDQIKAKNNTYLSAYIQMMKWNYGIEEKPELSDILDNFDYVQ